MTITVNYFVKRTSIIYNLTQLSVELSLFYRQIITENFELAKYFCYNDKYLHHVNMN